MAAINRAIAIFEGAFSRRDIVGCEHRGSPLSGRRPTAILKTGSYLSEIAIVGVFIARSDRKHPKPKHLRKRMLDALGLAPFPDARRKPIGETKLPLHPAQHKHARVR